jgi:release factor glutamine methyltransferase
VSVVLSDATLTAALAWASDELARAGVESPEVDARWLIVDAAGIDPRRSPTATLDAHAAARLVASVERRVAREPLQLIVGGTAFRSLMIVCRPGVFIPRPETEVLAGLAIDALRERAAHGERAAHVARPVLIEPCCGTGAIALAVASEIAGAEVFAADVDPEAVALAAANRDRLSAAGELHSDVVIANGHLLDAFAESHRGHVDVIVANPPYLPSADAVTLPPEVGAHDPAAALFGGPAGHEVVDVLIALAPTWLAPGGHLLLELDVRRGEEACERAREAGLVDVALRRDLTGAARFLAARRDAATP